jgi:hypothetical protein
MLFHPSYALFPHHLSQGSTDVPALLVEVAWAWEVVAAAEATSAASMLATKTSAWEVIAA